MRPKAFAQASRSVSGVDVAYAGDAPLVLVGDFGQIVGAVVVKVVNV